MSARDGERRTVALIGEFLNEYLPVVRRRDEDTVASYRTTINLFLDYLRDSRGVGLAALKGTDVDQKSVAGFLDWLARERGNAATTISHRLYDVRGLCSFLASRGDIDQVSLELIRDVSAVDDDRSTEFTWLSVDEVTAVIDSVSPNRDAMRDRFLLSLLYESGGRIGEVLSLAVGDIRPTGDGEADVRFLGKGKKQRNTPLSSDIWEMFDEYSGEYLRGCASTDLVFYTVSRRERHVMSQDNVARILNDSERSLREGDWPNLQHLHSHLFRRSRAMHLYEAGVPLPVISDWLGHSRIETTQFYAKVTDLMKHDAVGKLSEGRTAVFESDVAFKYKDDDETLRRLYGLR